MSQHVKLLEPVKANGGICATGAIISVPGRVADRLIANGKAEPAGKLKGMPADRRAAILHRTAKRDIKAAEAAKLRADAAKTKADKSATLAATAAKKAEEAAAKTKAKAKAKTDPKTDPK